MARKTMTPEEHARVAEAVRRAEEKTSGEIFCALARASDAYFFPSAFFVTIAVLVVGLIVAFLLDYWWFTIRLPEFAALQLLGVLAVLIVLWAFPAFRVHYVPHSVRRRRAHNNAVRQFLAHNIHLTGERTGVLLFLSMEERYAEVIADSGINERVEQKDWDRIVALLISHTAKGRLADGFCEAVEDVGTLLARHFPPAPDDRNELDDHLVEI
ncbi:MAG: TPM domain-containing protein [Rhizobiaceae bacterium]